MKERYNELKEDVLDEEKAIDETIEKLCRDCNKTNKITTIQSSGLFGALLRAC